MQHALANQLQERNGLHRYDLSQFGVNEEDSAARFAAYCDRFGLTARAKGNLVKGSEKQTGDDIDNSSTISRHQRM
jgi:hypothetical protein